MVVVVVVVVGFFSPHRNVLFHQGYTVSQGFINFNAKVSVWHIFVTCGPFLLLQKEDAKLKTTTKKSF